MSASQRITGTYYCMMLGYCGSWIQMAENLVYHYIIFLVSVLTSAVSLKIKYKYFVLFKTFILLFALSILILFFFNSKIKSWHFCYFIGTYLFRYWPNMYMICILNTLRTLYEFKHIYLYLNTHDKYNFARFNVVPNITARSLGNAFFYSYNNNK